MRSLNKRYREENLSKEGTSRQEKEEKGGGVVTERDRKKCKADRRKVLH